MLNPVFSIAHMRGMSEPFYTPLFRQGLLIDPLVPTFYNVAHKVHFLSITPLSFDLSPCLKLRDTFAHRVKDRPQEVCTVV